MASTSPNSKPPLKQQPQQPKREIGLLDLVFLSLGGQSPFLSILVYGAVALQVAGFFGPIAVALGTLLVLLNGMVIYKLSTRFTSEGGYFTYAYYSLTKRLGFETGWAYLLYSSFYGVAYSLGGAYVLSEILPIKPLYALIAVLGFSSFLVLLGRNPSFKYAVIAAAAEIAMMSFIALSFLYTVHFTFYNPFLYVPPANTLGYAILFGASIPTGYGIVTPLSGEVKDPKKNIPRTIITVILLGGFLAVLDIYAIGDHVLFYNLNVKDLNVLSLIINRFGLVTLAFALFAAANDAILSTLSYMIAASRTVFAMAYHGFFPSFLAKQRNSEPFNSVVTTVIAYWIIALSFTVASGFNVGNAFEYVALTSLFAYTYVLLASDFSLAKISLKRLHKRKSELILSLGAAAFTAVTIIEAAQTSPAFAINIFLLWLIIGFLVAEIIDMTKEKEEEEE